MFIFLSKITSGLNFLGSIWVFGLALLICADITLRTLLNSPILGVPEIVQYSIAGIIYLQLGQATKNGKLIRSDAFISRSHLKFPNFTQYLLSCLRARYYSNKCVSRSQILDMNLNSTYEKAFQMNSSSKDVSSIYI